MAKKKDNNYYVYVHRKKTNGDVFYVGEGKGKRAWVTSSRSDLWNRVVNKYGYYVEVLSKDIQEWYAFELEKELICKYGRIDNKTGILVNMSDGGDGQSGVIFSEDRKRKVSERQIGEQNPSYSTEIFKYYNIFTNEYLECTQYSFEEITGCYHHLARKLNSKGWCDPDKLTDEYKDAVLNNYKGKYSKTASTTKHVFVNIKTLEELSLTLSEFKLLTHKDGSKLIGKPSKVKSLYGYTSKQIIDRIGIVSATNTNKNISEWSITNINTLETVKGTKEYINANYKVDVSMFSKSTKCLLGWKLTGTDVPLTSQHYKFNFISKTGDKFFGTRTEFKDKYGFKCHHLFYSAKQVKGWTLVK